MYQRLENVSGERNQLVHQYWLYLHKGKKQIPRKKLEKPARLASAFTDKMNPLAEETGMDESFGLYEIRSGINLLL